ncbi:hypothetical protein OAD98_00505 [Flavobacteriales bacterium]|jgi:hypothetical protein|nr:hypothetical protein [Flavobacteriales bacterium]MDC0015024.1 hypothetical protein [Flavobacteriales bacterium]|tara:strand:+ start:1403 stop:1585 length:183 start_codon:yes stop_codon:yes gene_type:complete
MKKRTLFNLGLFLLLQVNLIGQNLTQVVKGQIIDKDTRVTIIGANVIIINSDPLLGAICL